MRVSPYIRVSIKYIFITSTRNQSSVYRDARAVPTISVGFIFLENILGFDGKL